MDRLVLRGGRVIDPASGLDAERDVVIEDGRIAAVVASGAADGSDTDAGGPDAADGAGEDVSGLIVTPGLVDLHGHWWEGSPYGLDPAVNLAGGVTTAVDAGTAGFVTFPVFRRHAIEPAPVRVLAFVHLAAAGLATTLVGELDDLRYARVAETVATIRDAGDVAVGVKVRIGSGSTGTHGAEALELALRAAELAATPLMTHIAEGADVADVLRHLRPGDILTHALTASGSGIRGADGRLLPELHDARRRGVLIDVGHGCGSFSWAAARAALAEGVAPDAISTDLHRYSVERPVVDLPLTMSKFLHLGMTLSEVVDAATRRPALAVRRPDLGTLRPGSVADVTVLRRAEEPWELTDAEGVRERVEAPLRPVLTIVSGRVHRAGDIRLPLRPLLDADREVDCSVPV